MAASVTIASSVKPRNAATSAVTNSPDSTPLRSAPAQNAGGAPVSTTTRAPPEAASRCASARASSVS